MPIVTLEGASAVGKTTTAKALCEAFDAYRIPEVNELFDTPEKESATWYFERQCDRWELAVDRENEHEVVVLDGDVLQPLWYNWIAQYVPNEHATIEEFASLESISHFYREKMHEGAVGFPDRYFMLYTDIETLRRRKRNDETRSRRNFDYHLQFVKPQRTYFERLQALSPEMVRFVRARSSDEALSEIRDACPSHDEPPNRYSVLVFDAMVDWLSEQVPPIP